MHTNKYGPILSWRKIPDSNEQAGQPYRLLTPLFVFATETKASRNWLPTELVRESDSIYTNSFWAAGSAIKNGRIFFVYCARHLDLRQFDENVRTVV